MEEMRLDNIEEAVEEFGKGNFVIVVDDEDRENEGDLIIAAEKITAEKVNFMLKHARGVLCAPITIERCKELDLPHQVQDNTSVLGTPFTVTVDKLEGCTTGVSAHDRAETIKALADPQSTPETFGRPGHVNPLYAQENGGDHERGWQHGTTATTDGNGQGMELENHQHQRYDCLPTEERVTHRSRRRSGYAYGLRSFPTDSFPSEEQWSRAYRTD